MSLSAAISNTAPSAFVCLYLRAIYPSTASSPKMSGIVAMAAMSMSLFFPMSAITVNVRAIRVSVMMLAVLRCAYSFFRVLLRDILDLCESLMDIEFPIF